MAVLRFPQASSITTTSRRSIRTALKPSSIRPLKASWPTLRASTPGWRSWVHAMDTYLCAKPSPHAACIVDELRKVLNQLEATQPKGE